MRRLTSLLLLIASAWLLAGCGDDESSAAGSDQLQVVATTTQVADLARNVAGGRAEVRGLLGPNVDPHDHEIRPSDLDGLSEARVVLQSGGDLDAWLDEAVRSAGGSPTVIELADAIRPAGPADDPHWWQDPRNAMAAVKVIRDALAKADPPDAGAYKAAADAYLRELESLDSAIAACMQAIPREARKLVTTHDALGYYADRYGVEVIGTVIPSRSTRGQPSAGETAELIRTIRRENVTTIFPESSVDPRVEEAIAREAGASVGDALYADTLGPAGSSGNTYLKSLAANTRALVAGFTQDRGRCDLPRGS